MKERMKNILLATLPAVVLFLAGIEALFRWFIPAAEFPETYSDGQYGILRFNENGPTNGVFTIGKFSEQQARWHINNYGWNSEIDYATQKPRSKPLIAIIGDSYIEALQVDVDKNVASTLRKKVQGTWNVYSFGISGAALSQYLQMSRYVTSIFDPEILIVNVVHNDFDESIRDLHPDSLFMQLHTCPDGLKEVPPRPYVPSRIKRLLRHSALARYLFVNLKIERLVANNPEGKKERASKYNANIDVVRAEKAHETIETATDYLVRRFRSENPHRRIIFMMDAPRADIYNGTLAQSNVAWLNRLLEKTCIRYGVEYIDLTPVFATHFDEHHQHFESQYDWHWNELGHRLAAERLVEQIAMHATLPRPSK